MAYRRKGGSQCLTRFSGVKQPDDVWFLAGTFGGAVSRAFVRSAKKSPGSRVSPVHGTT
jgi:hypothetical protein